MRVDAPREVGSVVMEEATLLDGMSSPEDEIVQDLFGAESQFVSENMPLKAPVAVKAEEDEFHVLQDAYLSPVHPKEPLLHAFNPPLNVNCNNKDKVELLVDENEEEEMLGEYPSLPELNPLEDTVLPAAPPLPPPAYNVHFLSSLLTPHRSPAVVPLGTWAREGAAHPGVRVIPVRSMWEIGTVLLHPSPTRDVRLLSTARSPSTRVSPVPAASLVGAHIFQTGCIPFVIRDAILPGGELCPGSLVQQASVLTSHRCYHGFRKGSLFMLEYLVSVKTNAM